MWQTCYFPFEVPSGFYLILRAILHDMALFLSRIWAKVQRSSPLTWTSATDALCDRMRNTWWRFIEVQMLKVRRS